MGQGCTFAREPPSRESHVSPRQLIGPGLWRGCPNSPVTAATAQRSCAQADLGYKNGGPSFTLWGRPESRQNAGRLGEGCLPSQGGPGRGNRWLLWLLSPRPKLYLLTYRHRSHVGLRLSWAVRAAGTRTRGFGSAASSREHSREGAFQQRKKQVMPEGIDDDSNTGSRDAGTRTGKTGRSGSAGGERHAASELHRGEPAASLLWYAPPMSAPDGSRLCTVSSHDSQSALA